MYICSLWRGGVVVVFLMVFLYKKKGGVFIYIYMSSLGVV